MAVISASNLNATLDVLVRYYLRLVGTLASGYGAGVSGGAWGAVGAVQDLKTVVLAYGDLDQVSALANSIATLDAMAPGSVKATNDLSPTLSALQAHILRYQIPNVRGLDDYLTYLNTGLTPKWQALQHPSWNDLVAAWQSTAVVSRWNAYFEVLQGATYVNALCKLVVGTGLTAGVSIGANYAGGFPQLRVSGLTGSDVVTVTGTAFDPATKATAAGKTWTATVAANGVIALTPGGATPAPADSLILDGSIAAAGGISAGTIYLEAARPAGRPALP